MVIDVDGCAALHDLSENSRWRFLFLREFHFHRNLKIMQLMTH